MTSFLRRFSVYELVIITMMASLGIAVKPVVAPLANVITGPLYIPGGVATGGLYMLWIVLGRGLVNRNGAGTMIGIVQALLVLTLGFFGTHGAMSLVTYAAPGVMVDLLYMVLKGGVGTPLNAFLGGMVANMTGTLMVSVVFFRLPWIPLLLCLTTSALSGGIGGLIAFGLLRQLKKAGIGALGTGRPMEGGSCRKQET